MALMPVGDEERVQRRALGAGGSSDVVRQAESKHSANESDYFSFSTSTPKSGTFFIIPNRDINNNSEICLHFVSVLVVCVCDIAISIIR